MAMATAGPTEGVSTCSICYESLTKPRELPRCGHKFCENCLLTYVDNLSSSVDRLSEFQCPNCREQISLPESRDELQNWVKSLEVSVEEAMDAGEKAEHVCGACKNTEESVTADKYCLDCQENLCTKCATMIHGLKLFKGHSLVDLKQTNGGIGVAGDENLLVLVANYMKCSVHPAHTISYICRDDNSLCCTECIVKNHRHCNDLENLIDESVKEETDTKAKRLKEQKDSFSNQVKLLMDFKKTNVAEVKKKQDEMTDKIKNMRIKVNAIFDALEEKIGSEAKALAKKFCIETEEDIAKLRDIDKTLDKQNKMIEVLKNVGSTSQMCIVLDKLVQEMDKTKQKFLNITKESRGFELVLKTGAAFDTIINMDINDTGPLASVNEVVKHSVPGLEMVHSQTKGMLVKVAEHEILSIGGFCSAQTYYSIVHRTKQCGLFLVSRCGGHESCFLTDKGYTTIQCIRKDVLTEKPFSAINLKNGGIAVSLPDKKRICFLSENNKANELQVAGSIDTKYTPKALYGLKNGNIAISWNTPVAFGILQFECNLYEVRFEELVYYKNDSAGRVLKSFDFMTVDETRKSVIQPCTVDKAVYCFDFEGNPKFRYAHEDLVCPRGVSISGEGNVFVCDESKSAIHVISPEGEGLFVLKRGCPEMPLAIAFDESGTQFAVSQRCEPWKLIRIFKLV